MKNRTFLLTLAAAATSLICSPATRAVTADLALPQITNPWAINFADTFTFDIAGFNSTSGVGYILGADQTATFGNPQTYTAAGYNGQDISITSGEFVNGATTTDIITVSTPTNFLTSTTVNGTKITALQLDIGDANSGVTSGTPNTLDYNLPVTGNTQTGNILYGTSNTSFTLTPTTTITNSGLSVASVEGVNDGSTAISTLAVHSFTYSLTYQTVPVPEPSTLAWGSLALAGCAGMVFRRRRTKA